MRKINNDYLKKYVDLDKEIKEKSKKLKLMKEEITNFLDSRDGKSLITKGYVASFIIQNRITYKLPDFIKCRYRDIKKLKILKVVKKDIDQ